MADAGAIQALRAQVERLQGRRLDVPVLPVYFHYPERVIGIGPLWRMGDDLAADMARVRAWYAPWQGKNRGVS